MKLSQMRNGSGFGIIEILVVVVVLGIVGAGGYLYYQQANSKDSNGLTNQEKAELTAACKLEIDDDLLCSAYTSWGNNNEPVTYTTTMTNKDGISSTSTSKYDGDNYHSVMSYDGQVMESIKLGNTSYTKMNGVWYKQMLEDHSDMPDMNEEAESDPSSQIDEVISEESVAKMSYKRVGEEACGSDTCVKFEITSSDDTNSTNYLWVNPKNNKLMRTLLEDNDGSSWDMVFVYGSVSITAPADAKDFSEMFNM